MAQQFAENGRVKVTDEQILSLLSTEKGVYASDVGINLPIQLDPLRQRLVRLELSDLAYSKREAYGRKLWYKK